MTRPGSTACDYTTYATSKRRCSCGPGVPVKNVSRRIGHRDAATTLNVYAHALADDDRVSADLVGDLLSPAAGAKSRNTSS